MTRSAAILATAALLLAACNGGAGNNVAGNNASSANSAAAVPPEPTTPPTGTGAVDTALLASHPWGPVGECEEAVTFNADGTATTGNESGNWTLSGSTLTLSKTGEPDQVFTAVRQGNNIALTRDGRTITISACPAGAPAAN